MKHLVTAQIAALGIALGAAIAFAMLAIKLTVTALAVLVI